MVTVLPAVGLFVRVIEPVAATALVVKLVPLMVTTWPTLAQKFAIVASKVPEPVALPSVRFNVFAPTVKAVVVTVPETLPEKLPVICLDVGLGVKVVTFDPLVIVTLPLLRTFALKVPVPVALLAMLD